MPGEAKPAGWRTLAAEAEVPRGGAGRPGLQGTPLRVEAGAGTEECSSPPMTVLISERLG